MTKQDQFLTIREAAELTGKATNTIRNLVKKHTKDSAIVRQIKNGKKNTYLINKNFLFNHHFSAQKIKDDSKMIPKLTQFDSKNQDEIVEILRGVIENQNEQLKIKDEQIQELTQLLGEQQNLTRNEQTLHLASKQKSNFLQRLFGKGNN